MKDNFRIWICSLFIVGIAQVQATAQGPPVFTETPIMLGLEGRGIRTFGKFTNTDNGNTYAHIIAFPYNINEKFQVGAVIPLVWKSPVGLDSRGGLGDLTLFLKQQVFKKDGRGKTLRALLKTTLTMPTGNTDQAPPLGTGAWQGGLGLVTGYITTALGLYAETGYRYKTNDLPGQFYYNLAASVPLLPQQYPPHQINLSVDLNGSVNTRNGNHVLLLSPALQWITGRKLLLESGVQVPLRGAPQTNFVLLAGLRVLIF